MELADASVATHLVYGGYAETCVTVLEETGTHK